VPELQTLDDDKKLSAPLNKGVVTGFEELKFPQALNSSRATMSASDAAAQFP
jgi:hypothetical protein